MSLIIEEAPRPGVVLLRLNRPEALNALNMEIRRELADILGRLVDDPAVRVVVVTGDDKAFAAGADIKAMAEASPTEMHRRGLHRLWAAVAEFRKPMIAAVRGFALGGGCELALHADIIVAGRGARFGLPEVRVGIMPGAGGTQRLVRAVGKFKAMRMLMTGEQIGGETAERWGLASEVVDDDAVLERALELAERIASGPAVALEHIKETVLLGADLPLQSALALERRSFQLLFDTDDQREGMAAFIERRKPAFKGE